MIRSLKIVLFLVLLAACGAIALYAAGRAPAIAVADSLRTAQNGNPSTAHAPVTQELPPALKLLKVEPVKGYVGDPFTVSGEGFAAGAAVEFFWSTVEASYVTKVFPTTSNTTSASTTRNVSCWAALGRMLTGG